MTILFWLERSRTDRRGHAPLKMRLQHKRQRINIGLDIKLPPDLWDNVRQRLRGKSELADSVNALIKTHYNRVIDAHTALLRESDHVTLHQIADRYKGGHVNDIGFLCMFDTHIKNIRSRIGVDFSIATVNKYCYSRNNLEKFIRHQFRKSDYPVRSVNRQFVMELNQYLRGELRFHNNHVNKTMEQIRKVFKLCVMYEYAEKNPFDILRFQSTATTKEFLSLPEMSKLITYAPTSIRMQETKDIFLFLCCTGLAHSDAKKATHDHIKIGVDEKPWLEIRRTKTGNLTLVPLLPLVMEMIERYLKHPVCVKKNTLLPIPTNQVLNRAIRLMLNEAGIRKHCSTHSGRYTFASTVLLANGVRMEVAQRFLAHSSIRSTAVYAKLSEHTLVNEIQGLITKMPLLG